jgi:hypothetical protein
MLQLSLIPGSIIAAASADDGSAVAFALSDLGWIFAVVALTLALAVMLQAVTRRRAASRHAKPLSRRSTDP